MAKQATKVNSKGEEGKVLETVTTEQAPQVAGAEKTKAKKNQSITVMYLDREGKECPLGENVALLRTITKSGQRDVDLAKLPKAMLIAAAAFGLNTTLRNAHNTTEHGGGDGIAALNNRISAIEGGEWRTTGEGGDEGVPLVIEAMIRAKRDAGAYVDGMEAKWLADYRGLDKDGKSAWTKAMSAKKPIEIALLRIKAERAAKKAESAANGVQGDQDF